jgi:predicted Zn finger-like uncharacterized protein
MIVQCENCSTKFNLPDDRIPKSGAKVKCSKCGNIFKVTPPSPPPPPPPEEEEDFGLDEELAAGGEAEAEENEDFFGENFDDDPAFAGEEEDGEEQEGFDDFPDEEEEDEEEDEEYEDEEYEDGDGEGFSLESKPSRKRGSKKSLVILLVLLIVLGGLGAAGWYFKDTILGESGPVGDTAQEAPPAQEAEAKPPVSPDEQVKGIGLKNVRQYYLDNEKAGQMFVVEGKAVNNFDSPKEMVTVQADLYDEKGSVLASKSIKCGNTLSMYQLQVETPEAIETALAADVGILANNTYLKKGMDTPFMVVFFNPSPLVREFQVKVVSAQDAKE